MNAGFMWKRYKIWMTPISLKN